MKRRSTPNCRVLSFCCCCVCFGVVSRCYRMCCMCWICIVGGICCGVFQHRPHELYEATLDITRLYSLVVAELFQFMPHELLFCAFSDIASSIHGRNVATTVWTMHTHSVFSSLCPRREHPKEGNLWQSTDIIIRIIINMLYAVHQSTKKSQSLAQCLEVLKRSSREELSSWEPLLQDL